LAIFETSSLLVQRVFAERLPACLVYGRPEGVDKNGVPVTVGFGRVVASEIGAPIL
jgi:hypothetical protein